jgi:hypothetical protein
MSFSVGAYALPSRRAYHKKSHVGGCVGRAEGGKQGGDAARVVMGRVWFKDEAEATPLGGV